MQRIWTATSLAAISTLSALIVGSAAGIFFGTSKTVVYLVMNGDWAGLLQLCVIGLVLLVLLLVGLRLLALLRSRRRTKTATVVVMGDIGRSPRMLNHASSLASAGFRVCVVGYADSAPPLHITNNPQISIRGIPPPWKLPRSPKPLYLLLAPLAALSRMFSLLVAIVGSGSSGVVLVQNPPSIPTLLVARLSTWLWSGAALVVDWHNYGYTIMQTTGAPGAAVGAARLYEKILGPLADQHLCVSRAMALDLKTTWRIPSAHVLYDRPPARFRRTREEEWVGLVERLAAQGALDAADFLAAGAPSDTRPALVVSSTSWTPDEDFGVLLEAMKELDKLLKSAAAVGGGARRRVHVIITGKGPTKAHYEALIAKAGLEAVQIRTAWLAAEDYPLLLGAADLGVSLHYSSSGLDLPMKVVDMFGCGLPVLSMEYACISELVTHNKTGILFADARGLAQHTFDLVRRFPGDQEKLERMRGAIVAESKKWEDEWRQCALPLFRALLPSP